MIEYHEVGAPHVDIRLFHVNKIRSYLIFDSVASHSSRLLAHKSEISSSIHLFPSCHGGILSSTFTKKQENRQNKSKDLFFHWHCEFHEHRLWAWSRVTYVKGIFRRGRRLSRTEFKCADVCTNSSTLTYAYVSIEAIRKKSLSAQSHTTIARKMEQIILNACNYRTKGSYFWEQQIPAMRVSLLVWLFQMMAERLSASLWTAQAVASTYNFLIRRTSWCDHGCTL